MKRNRRAPAYEPGQPFANQAYWESQGHSFVTAPDTAEQAAAKQAERDAVRARNSESVRAMFAAGTIK